MTNTTYTLEEYGELCHMQGEWDDVYIGLGYKIYLAILDGYPKKLEWATTNSYYNTYCRLIDRFN